MPGDESVTKALSDEVITSPVTSSVSIARGVSALPSRMPRETMRAAVRWAAPMPSPRKKMMFLARGARAPVTCQACTRTVTRCSLPSAVRARMVWTPARRNAWPRIRKLVVCGGAGAAR